MLSRFTEWLKANKKERFKKRLVKELKPLWLFDKSGYFWRVTTGRTIKVTYDQVGNYIVFDDLKMVSGYLKNKDEGQVFAINYIAEEIIIKYYKHLLK